MTKQESILIEKIRNYALSKSADELVSGLREEKNKEIQLCKALAACVCATKKVLNLDAFDEQLLAALALYNGKIIQMSTGEGKTLSAAYAAFLNVLDGKRVHILTFNDYLAKRDYSWMGGIYRILGVDFSVVQESSTKEERRTAYRSEVVYLTAKESGFDFLRDFVVQSEQETVHCGFDCAIVDEADSILIDEARIPLVIAGNIAVEHDENIRSIAQTVSAFEEDDYGISLETDTSYLTDKGVKKAEKIFGISNLYDEENIDIRTKINDALKAHFALEENVDYIVKDNEIQLIDEFTGRVAKNRHYPGTLQAAVEAKHNLTLTTRGTIMGTIPLQFFLRQYKKIAGMTGTALSSKEEFYQLYDLHLEVIPPHVPCVREDLPIAVYYDAKSKWKAIVNEIVMAHGKCQPILVGTSSIEESEELAEKLRNCGIDNLSVLNAKNDEMEADIIKNAGEYGAVTISTNMAGRGVDIKLGGINEKSRDETVGAGGLYVIGTSMSESSRIDDQLKGRAGRQGDIGKSRFFVAIDDEIMDKYGLKKLVPSRHWPEPTDDEITDRVIIREIERIQRISEGDTLDERGRLLKFNLIGEKHRDIIFNKRKKYITGEADPDMWEEYTPEMFEAVCEKFGKEPVKALERKIIIAGLNDFWCDYLEYTSYLREGIHLRQIGGENPSESYNIACETYFDSMEEMILDYMDGCIEKLSEVDRIEDYEVKIPSGTWTYLLQDSGDQLKKKPFLVQAMSEQEEMSEYADEYDPDDYDEEEETDTDESSTIFGETPEEEQPKKKGLFGRLFK